MSALYRDRAYCIRTRADAPRGLVRCANTQCDRYADRHVLAMASKAQVSIGWADLETSKCGFQPQGDAK